jgi:hypothetical protein
VSAQRYSSSAARRIEVSMITLRAFCARACFFGSACESSRVLSEAITEMCALAFSTVHSVVGGTQSSCSSLASS